MALQSSHHMRVAIGFAGLATLAGCAMTPMGPTVQVMPGPGKSFETFSAEQATCKSYAADQVKGQADAANQRAIGAALLTTAISAATGAAVGSIGGQAGSGAGVGAAVGAGAGSLIGANGSSAEQGSIQAQYDAAFSQCMYAKGDQVPGFAPVAVAYGRAAAAPDPVVRSAQLELNRLGYLRGGADGFMGARTRAAIVSFERANGLPADGAATPSLVAALQATPTGSGGGGTATASAPPPSGWVSPSASAASAPAMPPAAPAGWVTPAAAQ